MHKPQKIHPPVRKTPAFWDRIFAAICLISTVVLGTSTPAPAGTDDSLVFCVLGDSRGKNDGVNQEALAELADAFAKESPRFILFPGDLVSSGSERQLKNWRDSFMKPLLEKNISVYPCRGNHDLGQSPRSNDLWKKVFTGKFALPDNGPEGEKSLTYEVRTPNAVVFVMDCYVHKNQVNTAWLESRMKKIEPKQNRIHVFAMAHEPLFAVKHKDCLASAPQQRDKFLDILMNNGGLAYFCGHDHFYDHAVATVNGGEFHQLVCGGAGAPLYSWDKQYADKRLRNIAHSRMLSFMVVRIAGNKAVLTAKAWNPKSDKIEIIDSFSYTLK